MTVRAAFITTRYGLEVNGGAELHCRLVAEKMQQIWNVEILSTCALDYTSWDNHYTPGTQVINGLNVNRFSVDHPRPKNTFDRSYDFLVNLQLLSANLDIALEGRHLEKILAKSSGRRIDEGEHDYSRINKKIFNHIEDLEESWMELQGPVSTPLIEYLRANKNSYDIFVFFTLGYWTSYFGLPTVMEKSALVPTMHKEACMAFGIYKKFISKPRYLLFNTPEEKGLCHSIFPQTLDAASDVVGLGFDPSTKTHQDIAKQQLLLEKLPKGPFLLYIGRIDSAKGCLELINYFKSLKYQCHGPCSLVLIGQVFCEIPSDPNIISLGFLDEADKNFVLSLATIFVMPSSFESLSMALMEAWSAEIPALVNDRCDVLKGHCLRSNGGLSYSNEKTFRTQVIKLLENPKLRKNMGQQGSQYVADNYCWDRVIEKYQKCLESITHGST